jgi:ankyrin repeat protein
MGSAEEVEALLDAGVKATAAPAHGESAIWQVFHGCSGDRASADARIRILQALLAHGADINVHDENNNVPLMIAAKSCPLPVVRSAVAAGAKVNRVNAHDMSPLGWAFLMNKWDVAAYLVGQGARLKPSQRDGIFVELPTDPDKLDLIRRATAK